MSDDRSGVRVLIASRTYLPDSNAAAFRLGALVRGLAASHARVDVVTARALKGATEVARQERVAVHRWPVLRDRGGNVRGYVQYMSFDVPLVLRTLFRRFDVMVAEAPPTTGVVTAVVAAVRRRPFAYYAADVWSDGAAAVGAPALVVRLMRAVERFVLKHAAVVLSVSDGVNERLLLLRTRPSRIVTVGHGVDTSIFTPTAERASTERYFVYAGTMSEVHRPHVFVEAFALIAHDYPDLRLRFFGQGVYQDELRAMADRSVPGRVSFGGVISPGETARWLRGAVGALVSLAPGTGYEFAHPTKAYAAAACGTPIVFAGPDTFGSIVKGNDLGLTNDHDPVEVAAAMRRLLEESISGTTEAQRAARAAWARANVSLAAVGARAADAVLSVAGPDSARDRIDEHGGHPSTAVQEPGS